MILSNYRQKNFFDDINLFLIWLLPIGLIVGSLIINLQVLAIILIFFLNLYNKKETYLLKNKFLYLVSSISIYFIFTSYINFDNFDILDKESIIRSCGFVRFALLSFIIGYYIKIFGNNTTRHSTTRNDTTRSRYHLTPAGRDRRARVGSISIV